MAQGQVNKRDGMTLECYSWVKWENSQFWLFLSQSFVDLPKNLKWRYKIPWISKNTIIIAFSVFSFAKLSFFRGYFMATPRIILYSFLFYCFCSLLKYFSLLTKPLSSKLIFLYALKIFAKINLLKSVFLVIQKHNDKFDETNLIASSVQCNKGVSDLVLMVLKTLFRCI